MDCESLGLFINYGVGIWPGEHFHRHICPPHKWMVIKYLETSSDLHKERVIHNDIHKNSQHAKSDGQGFSFDLWYQKVAKSFQKISQISEISTRETKLPNFFEFFFENFIFGLPKKNTDDQSFLFPFCVS